MRARLQIAQLHVVGLSWFLGMPIYYQLWLAHEYLDAKLANRPGFTGWLWRHRHDRVVRNSSLSVIAWALMYVVFYVEVSRLNVNSQHAKLTISPLGAPFGFAIQWLVFKDRITVVKVGSGLWSKAKEICFTAYRTTRQIGHRWWIIKVISFGANQYAYAMMLHMVGLPYWLAYPAAASILSLVYYKMNNIWVFVDKWWEGPVMSYLCYHVNNTWLTWNLNRVPQTAIAWSPA